MDRELASRVEALRRPLELAAADGFAGVRKIQGLGMALRAACDGLMAKAPSDALSQWRGELDRWEQLADFEQQERVAKGMRLIARFPRSSTSTSTSTSTTTDPMAAPTH